MLNSNMENRAKTWTCGTLTYTRVALSLLFFWLIWGDICYTLMESVTGPIMLLKFKALGAPNWEVAVLLSTIPTTVYSIFNPIISVKSDRFRSRWGRRIPFILFSLPMLVLGLVGLAFGDRLGGFVFGMLHLAAASRTQAILWTLGMILVGFSFFNTFVNTTFWYLFNDVIPPHLLARFMSWFRFVGILCGAVYNFYIFPYSGTHGTEIFLGAAALYLTGFGFMCFNVREGEYLPPTPHRHNKAGVLGLVFTYAKECHTNRIYWYLWLCTFLGSIGGGIGLFSLYYQQAIGLNLNQIGDINGTLQIFVAVLILGAGWLADRYHPIRVVFAGQMLNWVLLAAGMIWLFWLPSPKATVALHLPLVGHIAWLSAYATIHITKVYLVCLLIYVGLAAPITAMVAMWDPAMLMRVLPRSNYGQFCSVNAIWRSVGGMLGGILAGIFLDRMAVMVGHNTAYFYSPVWMAAFNIPAFFFFLAFYRQWKRHGGDDNYVAPLPLNNISQVTEPVL
ncbi:MAG: hypothetical protein HKL95_07435 [Phycisphaerae bacterium]|nr:hypothetical protein [Phycisphaerae bacterium]